MLPLDFIQLLIGPLGAALAGIGVAIYAVLTRRRNEKIRREKEDAEEYEEIRKQIGDSPTGADSLSDALDRLRRRRDARGD